MRGSNRGSAKDFSTRRSTRRWKRWRRFFPGRWRRADGTAAGPASTLAPPDDEGASLWDDLAGEWERQRRAGAGSTSATMCRKVFFTTTFNAICLRGAVAERPVWEGEVAGPERA